MRTPLLPALCIVSLIVGSLFISVSFHTSIGLISLWISADAIEDTKNPDFCSEEYSYQALVTNISLTVAMLDLFQEERYQKSIQYDITQGIESVINLFESYYREDIFFDWYEDCNQEEYGFDRYRKEPNITENAVVIALFLFTSLLMFCICFLCIFVHCLGITLFCGLYTAKVNHLSCNMQEIINYFKDISIENPSSDYRDYDRYFTSSSE